MVIVKMDRKGRIQIPLAIREGWKLKPRQPLHMEEKEESLLVRKLKTPNPATDPLLRDIENPARGKRRLTKALLNTLKEEAWTP